MGLFRKERSGDVAVANPLEMAPEKVEVPEELLIDEILGDSTGAHFSNSSIPSDTVLYPVAGGVGLSTMVRASSGVLVEPGQQQIASSAILVATTSATHLVKSASLLRQGYAPNGATIVGVVLVHDRPKLSAATVKEAKKVIRMAKHGWVLPYVPALREPGSSVIKYPRRYRSVLAELARISR